MLGGVDNKAVGGSFKFEDIGYPGPEDVQTDSQSNVQELPPDDASVEYEILGTAEKLDSGELKGADLLKGGKAVVSEKALGLSRAGNVVKRDNVFKAAGKAIGRGFMRAAHAVKSFFNGDVFSSKWRHNNVGKFDNVIANRKFDTLPPLPPLESANAAPVEFDRCVVAAECGFVVKGKVGAENKQITAKSMQGKPLYPKGRPRLADIVQNPKLQDCWFLSGITSRLIAQGPEAIERLISYDEASNTCTVRMGAKSYVVPYEDVRFNGKSVTSDSAPWVKVLEQAAAMQMAEGGSGMIYGGMNRAQAMLSGEKFVSKGISADKNNLDLLVAAFKKGIPVEIGHVTNRATGAQKAAGIFKDGISPGHAVALMDVEWSENGKSCWLTVMDPYGNTRILSSDALERCEIQLGCSKEVCDALEREVKNEQKAV